MRCFICNKIIEDPQDVNDDNYYYVRRHIPSEGFITICKDCFLIEEEYKEDYYNLSL